MTASREVACKFCHRVSENPLRSESEHRHGCPRLAPDESERNRLVKLWNQGFDRGYADENPRGKNLSNHHPSYTLGWEVGWNEIEYLVQRAVESNYGYESDEDDIDFTLV